VQPAKFDYKGTHVPFFFARSVPRLCFQPRTRWEFAMLVNRFCVSLAVSSAFLVSTFVSSLSSQAKALPLASNLGQEGFGVGQTTVPEGIALEAADVDFTSIVALNNCSGALIRFKTSRDSDAAVVMTNGHCYEGGFLDPGEVAVNKPSSRSFRVLTPDSRGTVVTLRASKLLYATMTGTDLALYKVNETYGDLRKAHGLEPLVLSDSRPTSGSPMRVVSGYWKRIYACNVSSFIPELREGDWTFTDSIKFSRPGCETIGGTSGSPILHAETREVIGINNTGNESGRSCTVNNPCEVDDKGKVTVEKGASYGQQTYQVYGCLAADNSIDLTLESCALAKP
jgi:hypothetical protein